MSMPVVCAVAALAALMFLLSSDNEQRLHTIHAVPRRTRKWGSMSRPGYTALCVVKADNMHLFTNERWADACLSDTTLNNISTVADDTEPMESVYVLRMASADTVELARVHKHVHISEATAADVSRCHLACRQAPCQLHFDGVFGMEHVDTTRPGRVVFHWGRCANQSA